MDERPHVFETDARVARMDHEVTVRADRPQIFNGIRLTRTTLIERIQMVYVNKAVRVLSICTAEVEAANDA